MSLSGVEWQDFAVFKRTLQSLPKENLTEEEKYVSMWLKQKIEELSKKKEK